MKSILYNNFFLYYCYILPHSVSYKGRCRPSDWPTVRQSVYSGDGFWPIYLKPTKWKMTKMEDNQTGGRPKWKTTEMEDDKNGKQQKSKATNIIWNIRCAFSSAAQLNPRLDTTVYENSWLSKHVRNYALINIVLFVQFVCTSFTLK